MVSRKILYAGAGVGVVVFVVLVAILVFVFKSPELSTNSAIRSAQIITNSLTTGKSQIQTTNERVAADIKANFPPEIQDKKPSSITLYRYLDPESNKLLSLGAVGYITQWDKGTHRLTLANVDQQNLVFDLTPDPKRPIYEASLIPQTGQVSKGTDLAYHFCAYGDLVEVLWSDTRQSYDIYTGEGKIQTQDLGVIRPEGIVFYHRKPDCTRWYSVL